MLALKIFEPELNARYKRDIVKKCQLEKNVNIAEPEQISEDRKQIDKLRQEKKIILDQKNKQTEGSQSALSSIEAKRENIKINRDKLYTEIVKSLQITACECGEEAYPFEKKAILGTVYLYNTYYNEENCKQWKASNTITGNPKRGPKCRSNIYKTKEINKEINRLSEKLVFWDKREDQLQDEILLRAETAKKDEETYRKQIGSLSEIIEKENKKRIDLLQAQNELVSNGLMDKIVRLWSILKEPEYQPGGKHVLFSVLSLIFIIEISPILSKAVLKPGEYEELLYLQRSKTESIKKQYDEMFSSPTGGLSDDYFKKRLLMIEEHKKEINQMIIQSKLKIDKERITTALDKWKEDLTSINNFVEYVDSIDSIDEDFKTIHDSTICRDKNNVYQKKHSQSKQTENEHSLSSKIALILLTTLISVLLVFAYAISLDGHDINALAAAGSVAAFVAPLMTAFMFKNNEGRR